jgi:histidine triad (HIT) family protein
MSDCIFCKIAAGEIPSTKVFEDEELFAFRDIQPQAPHHILIVPKQHIAKLADTADDNTALLGKMVRAAAKIAKDEGLESGYRIVINNGESAGQSVWHLHLHLLSGRPFRWPPG